MLVRDVTDLDLARLATTAACRYVRRYGLRPGGPELGDLVHDCFIALRLWMPKRADEDLAEEQLAGIAYFRVRTAARHYHHRRPGAYRCAVARGEAPGAVQSIYGNRMHLNPHCDPADDLDRIGEYETEDLVERLACFVTPRERRVLLLYFTEGLELKAIGRLFDRSEAWASLTRTSALDKMLVATRLLR